MQADRRVLVLTEAPDWHTARLVAALEAHGVICVCASLRACGFAIGGASGLSIPGFEGHLPAAVFVRVVGNGSFEQVTVRLGILHALREHGIPVYNDARAIERCVDKSMTSFLLARAGLPTPQTFVFQKREQAAGFLAAMPGEFVLKPLFGAQGRGLRRLTGPDDLPEAEEVGGVFYVQRFVPPRIAGEWRDCRVFVIGGRAVAAMIRWGRSWVTNVHQGGTCTPAPSEGEHARLAVAATKAVGAEYGGVDLMQDADGRWVVLEVNSMPAWQGLQKVTDIDIAATLADDFLTRMIRQEACHAESA